MSSNFCKRCGAYVFEWKGSRECSCKPYEVSFADSEHAVRIHAKSPLEENWEEEPYDPSDIDEVVLIGEKRYRVTAEARVDFSAEEEVTE
jgi:hypothetical protein